MDAFIVSCQPPVILDVELVRGECANDDDCTAVLIDDNMLMVNERTIWNRSVVSMLAYRHDIPDCLYRIHLITQPLAPVERRTHALRVRACNRLACADATSAPLPRNAFTMGTHAVSALGVVEWTAVAAAGASLVCVYSVKLRPAYRTERRRY